MEVPLRRSFRHRPRFGNCENGSTVFSIRVSSRKSLMGGEMPNAHGTGEACQELWEKLPDTPIGYSKLRQGHQQHIASMGQVSSNPSTDVMVGDQV